MKEIGYTNDGDVIVEMTKDEYRIFCELSHAVDGGVRTIMDTYAPLRDGREMSDVFNRILQFARTMEIANNLVEFATECRDVMFPRDE